MLLVELTGATSEVGLLRWIFIPVSSRLLSPASSWVCGGWGGKPVPAQVRTQEGPAPLQHRPPPNPTQTGWVFAVGLQKPANLVAFGEDGGRAGWRQTRREFSAGIVAAPARHLLVSEWHRLVNELSVG